MATITCTVTFRKMVVDDIDAVTAIEQVAHYHPWTKNLLTDAITAYQTWLMFDQQQLLGYGMIKVVVGEAELLNIAIAPSQQNKGYGKRLLSHLMAEAEKLQAVECFLEVRESNHSAYKLYESFGFNEVGRRVNYYPAPNGKKEDALIMACLLGD